ncbi:MAG: hypothetical protein DCC58_05405 [Chloroflexi bacterium]|nr:MAG: hypothetical protein DCC58_05405 [Chloroflexota bacterium]
MRNGVQIAGAWRIWTQGDEFYAAGRDAVRLGKISFHRNNNWQLRLGTMMQRLAPGLLLSGSWRHALELIFLVSDDVLLPKAQREEKVVAVETPLQHKLLIDLLLTDSADRRSLMPVEVQGSVLREVILRSGKTLLVLGRVLPFTSEDFAAVADMRSKLRVSFRERIPERHEAYVEATLTSFAPGRGNVLQIIPVGPEALAVDAQAPEGAA